MSSLSANLVVFAHFGHWYLSFPVYFGPPALLAIYLRWSGRRHEREKARRRPRA